MAYELDDKTSTFNRCSRKNPIHILHEIFFSHCLLMYLRLYHRELITYLNNNDNNIATKIISINLITNCREKTYRKYIRNSCSDVMITTIM